MAIASIGPAAGIDTRPMAGVRKDDAVAQFDAMFYRLLLQSARWTGASGANRPELAVFDGMLTDFFAQEAARQQGVLGTMLLKAERKEEM